jgi:predicted RNA binding protein YcfA (HicA-like mRNA interferase family)
MVHTMNSDALVKRLLAEGWMQVHQKGSHRKFKHPARYGHVVVPHPRHDLPLGTLRSIYRQAGWIWR